MKFFWLFISALFFAQSCQAQESQLPQMPETIAISFNQNGAMSRSFRRIRIENGKFKFEQLEGNQQPLRKWTSAVSRDDLAKLYLVCPTPATVKRTKGITKSLILMNGVFLKAPI